MAAIFDFIATEVETPVSITPITLSFDFIATEVAKVIVKSIDLSALSYSNINIEKITIQSPNELNDIEINTTSNFVEVNQEFGNSVDELVVLLQYKFYGEQFTDRLTIQNTVQ